MCCVKLAVRTGRLNLIVIYRPPKYTLFFDDFKIMLDEVAALSGGLIVCGDFSCPSSTVGHADKLLERIVDDYDLVQHVNVPTNRHDGILDLFITSPEKPTIADVVIEDMGFPNHFMVKAALSDAIHARLHLTLSRNIKPWT